MNNLALQAALAGAATNGTVPYSLGGSYKPVAKHNPEQVPDWIQAEKIRKAKEKRARKKLAKGGES